MPYISGHVLKVEHVSPTAAQDFKPYTRVHVLEDVEVHRLNFNAGAPFSPPSQGDAVNIGVRVRAYKNRDGAAVVGFDVQSVDVTAPAKRQAA